MAVRSDMLALLLVPVVALGACTRQQDRETATESTSIEGPDTRFEAPDRSDTSIATAVQARLYGDEQLRAEDIDVRVENGVATLSGTVRSAESQQHAVNTVRQVEGVARVDDRLMVQEGLQGQRGTAERPQATTGVETQTPGWISTKIQAQYFVDADVKPWNIDVTTTSGGIVELSGEVDSEEARAEAVRIARETEGVTRVEDRLRVRGGDARSPAAAGRTTGTDAPDASDPWLTVKVQSKYFLDTDVKGRNIEVTTRDGVVTLAGTVESESERRQAVALARNTDGVIDVRDELQVRSGAETASRPGAERQGDARGTTGADAIGRIEDAWITTKIQSKFFLERDVKSHEINVDTRNGVVTLKGSVESDARKQLAEQIARETEGVNRVVNQLAVAPDRQG